MRNMRMHEKLQSGDCLDVRSIGEPTDDPAVFKLRYYEAGFDYCDAETERWIWSIGRRRRTLENLSDETFAATDARFYQNPDYECLWLR